MLITIAHVELLTSVNVLHSFDCFDIIQIQLHWLPVDNVCANETLSCFRCDLLTSSGV